MIKTTIEKMSNSIGYDIGMSDDGVQSDLLNGFFKALTASMDSVNVGNQVCYIVDKLDNNALDLIIEFSEFVKCRKLAEK